MTLVERAMSSYAGRGGPQLPDRRHRRPGPPHAHGVHLEGRFKDE